LPGSHRAIAPIAELRIDELCNHHVVACVEGALQLCLRIILQEVLF
jgi:hypothetical protein